VSFCRALAAAAVMLSLPHVAQAKSISEKEIVSGKVKLDPATGYIFVSSNHRQQGLFLRVPDAETWAKFTSERETAWTKAKKRYKSDLAVWEAQNERAQELHMLASERPKEPSIADLNITPAELRDMESFGPMFVFGKGEGDVAYLNSVKPGTYVWYGPMSIAPNGAVDGSCFCLGTVQFEVKAGSVTDLGNLLESLPQWSEQHDVPRMKLAAANAKQLASGGAPLVTFAPIAPKSGLPASMAGWPRLEPVFKASPKMNNYFGTTISRLPPIPGVLAYRRDTVIDARSGQDVESSTLLSRQKIKK
jgi:hypothetical protein